MIEKGEGLAGTIRNDKGVGKKATRDVCKKMS